MVGSSDLTERFVFHYHALIQLSLLHDRRLSHDLLLRLHSLSNVSAECLGLWTTLCTKCDLSISSFDIALGPGAQCLHLDLLLLPRLYLRLEDFYFTSFFEANLSLLLFFFILLFGVTVFVHTDLLNWRSQC